MNTGYKTVDEYLDACPDEARGQLQQLRKIVHEIVPEAEERISYGIPTYTYHGNLLHFAGYKTHIGFYPGSGPIKELSNALKGCETSKGTIRFPHDKPLPMPLIKKVIEACVKRNETKNN